MVTYSLYLHVRFMTLEICVYALLIGTATSIHSNETTNVENNDLIMAIIKIIYFSNINPDYLELHQPTHSTNVL